MPLADGTRLRYALRRATSRLGDRAGKSGGDRMASEGIVLVVLILLVVAVIWFNRYRKSAHLDSLRQEAEEWAVQARGGLPAIETQLILKENEHGLLEEESALMETRAYRVYGGAGTRIGRLYVGGGRSESHQRLKLIDEGTLTLTTKRLVFDGSHENRNVQLSQVLSVRPWADAIEVSTQRRAKSQVYRVRNPLIWMAAIEAVASGNFRQRHTSET
jgi:hypothetical protein